MGYDPAERQRCVGKATREQFVGQVKAAGGTHCWFLKRYTRTVAYQDVLFRARLDALIAREMGKGPSAEEIWDTVTV